MQGQIDGTDLPCVVKGQEIEDINTIIRNLISKSNLHRSIVDFEDHMDSNQYLSDNFSGLIEGVRGNNDAGRGESRVYHGDFRNNFVKIALSST